MLDENTRILLCEDDENLGMLLSEYLQVKGYICDLYANGEDGLQAFSEMAYDMCLLDIMMPKMDGLTLASEIRLINPDVPIIFLTAKNLKQDVLEGFRHGCDDYITKPFSMEELLLRMEAILRRMRAKLFAEKRSYTLGKFIYDSQKQQLVFTEDGTSVKLTTKEADLLTLLCANIGSVVSRDYTLRTIWIDETSYNARSMDVYITKLRRLLVKDPTVQIVNIHGKGYKITTPQSEAKQKRVGKND